MRPVSAMVLGLTLGAGLMFGMSHVAVAGDDSGLNRDEVMVKAMARPPHQRRGFLTSATDTVWFGFKATSPDPNKVWCGVGSAGPKWDFDTGIADADSAQYWRGVQAPYASDANVYTTPQDRPFWYYDFGNNINLGDHNLWKARALAGRVFRRTGLAGVWHVDDMSTVPNIGGGFRADIAGTHSAWCGLRVSGDANAPVDELTGNRYDSAEQFNDFRGGGTVRSAYPGYANLWNQLLYRDFAYSGAPIPVSFRMRAYLSRNYPGDAGGSAWFTPDPTSLANLVTNNPRDSLMVWVGAPKETGVYDTNRRYLSEVIDFAAAGMAQPQVIYATTGIVPQAGNDSTITALIPGGKTWGPTVRVVFQVHTNRTESDLATAASGFNSPDGAVVLDDVNIGGNISGFESQTAIRPRVLLAANGVETVISPSTTWITTGRPPAQYGHVHNANSLPYQDPCGTLGSVGARLCNLNGNILLQSNHDDPSHSFYRESVNWLVSPTIVLNPVTGPARQGTPTTLRTDAYLLNIECDYYSGFDDPYEASVFYWYGVRYVGQGLTSLNQVLDPKVPAWSPVNASNVFEYQGVPTCITLESGSDLDGCIPIANVDSLQVCLENQTRCGRFGATACGATRGSYWDNIKVGFVRGVVKPALSTVAWCLLGDTFPFNELTLPGSADFDTTTALVKNAMNNGNLAGGEGVIAGDSLVYSSPFAGDDTRLDLVFRIMPGPGNYSNRLEGHANPWDLRHHALLRIPSNQSLTVDASNASDSSWWALWMRDNGEVGSTPSGHTATYWDPQTWNSARMDSAEAFYSPLAWRGVGIPVGDLWQGTYHELDPKYNLKPAANWRNLCFLVTLTGPINHMNTCCDPASCADLGAGWPPSAYPVGTPRTSHEGTKILPDGLFTPGTHIQYFVRRSAASAPLVLQNMSPDTTTVTHQGGMGGSIDQVRYDNMDVLPDRWKDTRFGGSGLACILYVDAADRRGFEPALRGALDSLGYGLDNGAERGWKCTPATFGNPDDPVGFVPENLGQAGLSYDKFDIRAAESGEGDRPGCRLAQTPWDPKLIPMQCKQGPTIQMLDQYTTIIWDAGDLQTGAMHDGCSQQEQSWDTYLINQWLALAAPGHEKAFWGMGDGLVYDLSNSSCDPQSGILLNQTGTSLVDNNYYDYSFNPAAGSVFQPLDVDPTVGDPLHSARRYGMLNSCRYLMDVIEKDGSVSDAYRAARYEQSSDRGNGGAGPYYSAVYRWPNPGSGRYYETMMQGWTLARGRTWNGSGDPTTANNYAQRAWAQGVLDLFGLCALRWGPPNSPDPLTSIYPPDVTNGPAMDGLGVSPANGCVPLGQQYFYCVQLRDSAGWPVAGFPAAQIWLDFSGHPPTRGRPADGRVHPDGDSDAEGTVWIRQELAFGGADSTDVGLYVVDALHPQGYLLHRIPGGVHSPDEDGDGYITPIDIDIWTAARDRGGPLWQGDIGGPAGLDNVITIVDSTFLASHRGCGLCYEAVAQDSLHRIIVQGVADYDAHVIRGMIKSGSEMADTTVALTPSGSNYQGSLDFARLLGCGDFVDYASQYKAGVTPDSLAEHTDSIHVATRPAPGAPDSTGVTLDMKSEVKPDGVRVHGDLKGGIALDDKKLTVEIQNTQLVTGPKDYEEHRTDVTFNGKDYSLHVDRVDTRVGGNKTSVLAIESKVNSDLAKFHVTLSQVTRSGADPVIRVHFDFASELSKHFNLQGGMNWADDGSRIRPFLRLDYLQRLFGYVPMTLGWQGEYEGKHKHVITTPFIHFDFPFAPGGGLLAEEPGRIVAEQQLQVLCDDVWTDFPVIADSLAMSDTCGDMSVQSAIDIEACETNQTLDLAALPCGVVSVPGPASEPPRELRLEPISPNPARGTAAMIVGIPRSGVANLSIFDIRGRRVATVIEGTWQPGTYRVAWDGRDRGGARLPAGVYFARLSLASELRIRRFVLMR